jgi:hypothetical protein
LPPLIKLRGFDLYIPVFSFPDVELRPPIVAAKKPEFIRVFAIGSEGRISSPGDYINEKHA